MYKLCSSTLHNFLCFPELYSTLLNSSKHRNIEVTINNIRHQVGYLSRQSNKPESRSLTFIRAEDTKNLNNSSDNLLHPKKCTTDFFDTMLTHYFYLNEYDIFPEGSEIEMNVTNTCSYFTTLTCRIRGDKHKHSETLIQDSRYFQPPLQWTHRNLRTEILYVNPKGITR